MYLFRFPLFSSGFEQFSKYTGYADSFQYDGNYEDPTPVDPASRHRRTQIVAIDALNFRARQEQYVKDNMVRELNKAFVGFKHENRYRE